MRRLFAAACCRSRLRACLGSVTLKGTMKGFLGWLMGVALVGGGMYYFFFAGGPAEGVQIIFKGPEKIAYGAPFELTVGIGNASDAVWKNASLALTLPAGFVFADPATRAGFITKHIGDMGTGSFMEVPFTVMAVARVPESEVNVLKAAHASADDEANGAAFYAQLSYGHAGSSAVFEKTAEWMPPTPASGFNLEVIAPETVVSGETVELTLPYANRTGGDLDNLVITAEYPSSFVFISASTSPDTGENTWNIGGLKQGSSDSITIRGRFTEQGTAHFAVSAVRAAGLIKYPIAVSSASVEVATAPLTLTIDVNDTPDYVARTGDTLAYTLSYTMDGMKPSHGGLAITADLFSPLFDTATIMPAEGGIFGRGPEGTPRISWHIAQPDTEGGSVHFSIKIKNDYGISRLGDRNFVVKVRGEVLSGGTVGTRDHETKVMGRVDVSTRGYFRDAASGIVNKGTIPPKVGNRTEYTIHWNIVNYATDVRGITIRADMPQGVTFTGVVKSNIETKPTYDAATHQVVWNIDRIAATTGLFGTAPEAIFQIASVPIADMKGKNAPLLGMTDVSATDDFTDVRITASAAPVTTALPDDATAVGQGSVQ